MVHIPLQVCQVLHVIFLPLCITIRQLLTTRHVSSAGSVCSLRCVGGGRVGRDTRGERRFICYFVGVADQGGHPGGDVGGRPGYALFGGARFETRQRGLYVGRRNAVGGTAVAADTVTARATTTTAGAGAASGASYPARASTAAATATSKGTRGQGRSPIGPPSTGPQRPGSRPTRRN